MKKSMLFTTIAMIVVVVVALSTATFAWFSATTTSAIVGNVQITAATDYVFEEVSNGKWVNASQEISLGISEVQPVSMIKDYTADESFLVKHDVDANVVPTEIDKSAELTTNKFFSVTHKSNDIYTNLRIGETDLTGKTDAGENAEATRSLPYVAKSIRVSNASKLDFTAALNNSPQLGIKIKSTGSSLADQEALAGIQVIAQISTFGASADTLCYGTYAKWSELVQQVDPNTDYKITAKVPSQATNLQEIPEKEASEVKILSAQNGGNGDITKLDKIIEYWTQKGEVVNKVFIQTTESSDKGLYRYINLPLPDLKKGDFFVVTFYVFVDGNVVSNGAKGKSFDVNVSFGNKKVA